MNNKFDLFDDDDHEEDGANWQDSYSDLVTDLLAVFVILFSFAMMSQVAVANSVKSAEVNILPNQSASGEGIVLPGEIIIENKENFNKLYESIEEYIEEEHLEEGLSAEKHGDSQILLRVNASVFFESGRADIHESAAPIMEEMAQLFIKYDPYIQMIRIEGHTDNVPISTGNYNSNWDLSVSRAVNVLREMVELTKMEPKKYSAVGYSEFNPIESNETVEGRSNNRRVDFFIESIQVENEEQDSPNE